MLPNGWRYRQVRDLAGKTTRRRIRRWGQNPESVGESPHLSGGRGVGQVLQGGFDFDIFTSYIGGLHSNSGLRAIPLTKVTPSYSVPGYGGVPPNPG